VGHETKTWEAGKCLIFDDTFEHEVLNPSNTARIILLIDFKKA
jgi:beta-hydroxylase